MPNIGANAFLVCVNIPKLNFTVNATTENQMSIFWEELYLLNWLSVTEIGVGQLFWNEASVVAIFDY